MSDLTRILGANWSPDAQRNIDPPETQLRNAIIDAGLAPPDKILLDGKIHRFNSGTKGKPGHSKPGWVIAFSDGVPAGRFGCWRAGIEIAWRADVGRELTASEEMAHARRMGEAQKLRDDEMARKHEVAASTVLTIWTKAGAADSEHKYLERKGIDTHGARITGDGRLMVPLYNRAGKLASLQYISDNGEKLYHAGGKTNGNSWMIGTLDEPGTLYIAEGFATAATIHEHTHRPCIVAYSASNLVPVTGVSRETYGPTQDIVIVADNDESGVGQKYADQASAKYGARVIVPPVPGDANDYAKSGHDLSALLNPPKDNWLVSADDFSSKPAPITWLVKRWVQSRSLMMIHGPSGSGKTFITLDWCLRMAAGLPDWLGNKVKPANVVYLAGEGHHGLRGRIAAWKQHHKVKSLNMWVSRAGCDLNTAEGYAKVVEHIRALPAKPDIINVDTLHRFLCGDENSAQDTKTMLDACSALMREFDCTVNLVHHTGVSEDAQHRARGSSAWRGALDIEISVIPPKGEDLTIQITQRKSKDSELAGSIFIELQQVNIKGWLDEDGESVTSAVVIESAEPSRPKKETKLDGFKRTLERCWWESGAQVEDGAPYISRDGLAEKLAVDGLKSRTIANYLNPAYDRNMVGCLLNAGVICPHLDGWKVVETELSSVLIIRKNSNG